MKITRQELDSSVVEELNEIGLLSETVDNMYHLTDGQHAKIFTGNNLNDLKEAGLYFIPAGVVNVPTNLSSRDTIAEVIVAKDNKTFYSTTTYNQIIYDTSPTSRERAYIRKGDFTDGFGSTNWYKWDRYVRVGTQEDWITVVMSSGTPDIAYPIKYYKDDLGVVHVSGEARGTFIAWNMPVGYRPERTLFPIAMRATAGVGGTLSAQSNGYFIMNASTDDFYHFHFSYRAKVE